MTLTDDDAPPHNRSQDSQPTLHVDPDEHALLGAMLLAPKAIDVAIAGGLEQQAFTTPGYPELFAAAVALHRSGKQVDPITITNHLAETERQRITARHGQPVPAICIGLQADCPATSSAPTYTATIHAAWTARAATAAIADASEAIRKGAEPRSVITAIHDRLPADHSPDAERARPGGTFILDQPEYAQALWGDGQQILWAENEPLMINGPTGIGKTTICQQVVLGRIGLQANVLEQPVCPASKRVLYVAADRPAQAARSMRRMVAECDRGDLDELLIFWPGPLPFNVIDDTTSLVRFARKYGADTLIIDSLKDICHKLTDDEQAAKTNAAIQEAIVAGIQVCVLHHQRKQGVGAKKDGPPKHIDDVYGSTWLTAGMGSVLLVWGQAGDPLVELSHLKSPAEQVGPWTLHMDFDAGRTTLEHQESPLKIVGASPRGATVNLVARLMFNSEEPTRNDLEKTRRRLEKLVADGLIHRQETATEGGGKPTTLYFPIDTRRTA